MRTLTTLMLTLLAALLVTLLDAPELRAEATSDRIAIHRKYQTSPGGEYGRANPWQNEARYEKRRERAYDRRADQLAWRDYHGYAAKHYQIQSRYGLYSQAAALRADYDYNYNRRHNKGNRRGGAGSCNGRR